MKRNWRQQKTILAALALVLTFAIWITFAPIQLGGQTGYVMLSGNSMMPKFFSGDLVIVRAANDYQLNDIVAYRHPDIGPVFHRIVALENNQFILQGDNNEWLDSFHPGYEQIIGRLWFHFPRLGNIIKYLHSPAVLAFMALGFSAFAVITFRNSESSQKGKRPKKPSPGGNIKVFKIKERFEEIVFAVYALLFASLLLGAVAFRRPLTRVNQGELLFRHNGSFEYTAKAPPGVYDSTDVKSGEPVFRRLSESFTISFYYELESEMLSDVKGNYQLIAEIHDVSGWKRTIELNPSTSFVGPSFDVSSVIEFQKIQKFVDNFEARTGIQRGQYILSIKPYVSVEGKFGKENLIDQYAPMLNFRFDELQIQLVNDNPADENVLRPSQGGVVPQYTQEDNTISILNSEITVLAARWVSILGVALSIGAILYFSLLVKESERQGEAAKIALLYSAWVVPVSHFKESSKPIEVQEFSELIKLAESCGKLIFHEVRGDAHHYYLQDDQGIFHYQALPFVDRGEPRDPFIGRLVGKTKEFLSLGYSKIRKGSAPDQAEND